MKILIIEDEVQARDSLKKLINLVCPNNEIIFETGRVDTAIKYLKTNSVDLVFLDIELEDGNGFEVLNAFTVCEFKVIITTAFDNKAIEAYRANAMDYLLKPIGPYELQSAFERVVEQLKIEAIANTSEKKLNLKTTNAMVRVTPSEIIRLEADGAYTRFVTRKKNILVSKNLQYYQSILGSCFLRVHRSHLVRHDQISAIKGTDLYLINGDIIPVSSRKKLLISKKLQ